MTIQEIKARNEEREKLEAKRTQGHAEVIETGVFGLWVEGYEIIEEAQRDPDLRICQTEDDLIYIAHCYNNPPSADVSFVLAENERLERELHRLQLGDITTFEYERLVAWIKDPNRKQAMFAFTAGAVRSAASAIEESGILNP